MSFNDTLRKYGLNLEADQLDAAAPPPGAPTAPVPQPAPTNQPTAEPTVKQVSPEGYVNLVRLLAQALVMSVPDDAIDDLFNEKITPENAETIREGLEELMNTSKTYGQNEPKLENPNFKKFLSNINENNFYSKLDKIKSIMEKYSNNVH